MFSAIGTVAVTSTGRRSAAHASTAPTTAAAPPMSDFIQPMFAVLMFRPPESNVMPLPTSATFATGLAGRWARRTSRGGRDEPEPTARIAPNLPRLSARSSSTSTCRPSLPARSSTRAAKVAG